MRAIEFKSVEKAEIVDVPKPVPAHKEVLVRLKSVGICHSDIMAYKGLHPYRIPPVITGHEAAGVVEALGEDVSLVKVGDRVAIEPHMGCGRCGFCRQGQYQVCAQKKLVGVGDWIGAFSEFCIASESMCHRMPNGMSYDIGAMLEPYCVGLHAVRQANIFKGASVAVLGCGTIGMMTLVGARQTEAGKLIVSDLSANKRSLSLILGADAAFNPLENDPVEVVLAQTEGKGVDIVFQTAPVPSVLNQALRMAKRRGKVILVAVLAGEVPTYTSEIQLYERVLLGSAMYNRQDYEFAIEQWRQGHLNDIEKLLTNRITLDEAPAAIAEMAQGNRGEDIKNIINID